MNSQTKLPRNLNWITPYLTVKDVAKAVAFYRDAFGFTESVVLDGKDGTPVHAEISYKGCVIMLGTHPDQTTGAKPPNALGGTSVRLYIYADDVDALVERARKSGAVICEVPTDQYWGERTGSVRDLEGHVWWIATKLQNVDDIKAAAHQGYAPQR